MFQGLWATCMTEDDWKGNGSNTEVHWNSPLVGWQASGDVTPTLEGHCIRPTG
jgi:hypothetical protein